MTDPRRVDLERAGLTENDLAESQRRAALVAAELQSAGGQIERELRRAYMPGGEIPEPPSEGRRC